MKTVWLFVLAFPLIAAAPMQPPLTLAVPAEGGFSLGAPARPKSTPSFQPAPLPNRDLSTPQAPRASNETSVAPTLFTTRTQFRGDGFSPGSTAQSEQEHKIRPGAGISFHMPLSPQ
ncbi:MAG: hypothetical protein M3N26_03315 [Pseudomonadota bacterium]|nr:hypothetical protein [Pseudomonadota bacterium]